MCRPPHPTLFPILLPFSAQSPARLLQSHMSLSKLINNYITTINHRSASTAIKSESMAVCNDICVRPSSLSLATSLSAHDEPISALTPSRNMDVTSTEFKSSKNRVYPTDGSSKRSYSAYGSINSHLGVVSPPLPSPEIVSVGATLSALSVRRV